MTTLTALPHEASFLHALDTPGDHIAMLVFADYLADHSDPREAGYRELARIGFVPFLATGSKCWGAFGDWSAHNAAATARVSSKLINLIDCPTDYHNAYIVKSPLFRWSQPVIWTTPRLPTNRPSTLIDALARAYATLPRA